MYNLVAMTPSRRSTFHSAVAIEIVASGFNRRRALILTVRDQNSRFTDRPLQSSHFNCLADDSQSTLTQAQVCFLDRTFRCALCSFNSVDRVLWLIYPVSIPEKRDHQYGGQPTSPITSVGNTSKRKSPRKPRPTHG